MNCGHGDIVARLVGRWLSERQRSHLLRFRFQILSRRLVHDKSPGAFFCGIGTTQLGVSAPVKRGAPV
jgi:hypothetical protein